MLPEQTIQGAVERIVAAANPTRVILFGSYARGEANEDSDLDLMVVEKDVPNVGEEMVRLRSAVGSIGIGVDVLVYSEQEFAKRREWCSSPVYWAVREGKVLYG
ncbi:MAG: nucleotidyltransferase domain-containing protein [Sulfuritalea sp.]|nr:nucleotidyltransferase domain-containing protein [Sulfuritalea sp.]